MQKIDITITQPPKRKENKLEDFLFYLIQWTWGLSVNAVGGLAYLFCIKVKKFEHAKFGYANIVYVPWRSGGLSMGLFIFIKKNHERPEWTYNTRIHEYGHTWQCLLLGPLYYIVIALPSVIWCNFFEEYRKRNKVSYYWLYCEGWANAWGMRSTGMKMVNTRK